MVIFLLLLAGSCGDEGSQTTTITSTSPEESVSAGYLHTCEVKSDGTVVCWGNDEWGQATPPPGEKLSKVVIDAHLLRHDFAELSV